MATSKGSTTGFTSLASLPHVHFYNSKTSRCTTRLGFLFHYDLFEHLILFKMSSVQILEDSKLAFRVLTVWLVILLVHYYFIRLILQY